MKKFIIVATIALLMQGCATPYQATGFTGGYDEIQLDENVFKVSFRGNGYTGRERATNFTLLRSAELTLEKGYKYFVIVEEAQLTRTVTTPKTYTTTANAYGGFTTQSHGGHTISKPRTTNTIVLHKQKPDSAFSYNAEFLFNSMKEKYGIE